MRGLHFIAGTSLALARARPENLRQLGGQPGGKVNLVTVTTEQLLKIRDEVRAERLQEFRRKLIAFLISLAIVILIFVTLLKYLRF